MSDRSAQVRHCGVVAAGKIGDVDASGPVIACLHDKQETVAVAAAATLHHLQTEDGLQALLQCLLKKSPLIIRGAVVSLSRWHDAETCLHLLIAAGAIGAKAASKRLRPEARAAACETVGYLRWPPPETADDEPPGKLAAYAALLPMLSMREDVVRVHAALALGRLSRHAALAPLAPLLRDKSALVVEAAVNAIEALDWSPFLDDQESVVLTGPVLKRMKGHGRSNLKQLLLTSGTSATPPRLFYVDALTLKLKECELRADVDGGTAERPLLALWQDGKPARVQCLVVQPPKWVDAISALLMRAPPTGGTPAPAGASHSALARSESSLAGRRQHMDKI